MSKPSEKKNNWPVAYRWAAMGTLVIYTAVGTKTVSVAWAQQDPAPGAAASIRHEREVTDICHSTRRTPV